MNGKSVFLLILVIAILTCSAVFVAADNCGLVQSESTNPNSGTFQNLKFFFTGGETQVKHWKDKQAKYWINKLQAPAPVANPVGEINAAANTWSNSVYNGRDDFNFVYQSTTDRWAHPDIPSDGYSVVAFQTYESAGGHRPLGVTKIKKTQGGIFPRPDRIEEVDTVLNTYYGWDDQPYPGRYDVQTVVLHEFGHWLELYDLAESDLPPSEANKLKWYNGGCDEFIETVMYYKAEWYSTFRRQLTWIDQWGKWYIYSSQYVPMAPPISVMPTALGEAEESENFSQLLQTQLLQNMPNPFNPDTWIPYILAEDSSITIRISNAAGQVVRTLELGEKRKGKYLTKEKTAYWDGKNDRGEKVATGVYFYTLQAGDFSETLKMLLIK